MEIKIPELALVVLVGPSPVRQRLPVPISSRPNVSQLISVAGWCPMTENSQPRPTTRFVLYFIAAKEVTCREVDANTSGA